LGSSDHRSNHGSGHGSNSPAENRTSQSVPPPLGLHARYCFETFVKGGCNELAASAAMAAADEPGRRFNPLFIYGGVGLGKTHLLHGVGLALHRKNPASRIVYLSAEQFMNEFVTAVRNNEFDQFRTRYRRDCDCLLIDDIQFIAGRDRTMDEFFHVFNALYEAGKQIVVTADRVPADMPGMEERLTSRLNWGLVADVQPPDLETRIAIVQTKAERDGLELSPVVALSIAELVRSNVRELEGALLRVTAFAQLRGVELDAEFVRATLGRMATDRPPISIDSVQKAVAAYFSVRIADLKGKRRHRGISRPRMIAMYLSRQLTTASFPEIGMRFGGKDHSTVINACKRIEELAQLDEELRTAVESLRSQLK
jgi:chromosomal replication initiator protein